MTEETSGNPKPQAEQVRRASVLLNRARFSPKSARHVQNIAKADAKGHPGAQVAQAAIAEARRKDQKRPIPAATMPPPLIRTAAAFTSWARGAA